MEQHLFIFLLSTGLSPLVLSLPREYYLIQKAKTWSDAQTYCRATYVDLATIESSGEMIKLQNVAQTQKFSSDAWVGLYYDINNWYWSLDNEPVGSMTNWCSYRMGYTCALIMLTCWQIHPCIYPHPFICFDDRLTGSEKYVYYNTKYMTWFDAQTYCRKFHTDLASARNATEDSLIRGKITYFAWFGLTQNQSVSWKWSDQTISTTINWLPGQPDNLGSENCVSVFNGKNSNYQCSLLKAFYCYGIITGQQQMIKLNIQSSTDVNDDATMEALLEKIKQKLVEHGLQNNITVKWRKQAEGKVFQKTIE